MIGWLFSCTDHNQQPFSPSINHLHQRPFRTFQPSQSSRKLRSATISQQPLSPKKYVTIDFGPLRRYIALNMIGKSLTLPFSTAHLPPYLCDALAFFVLIGSCPLLFFRSFFAFETFVLLISLLSLRDVFRSTLLLFLGLSSSSIFLIFRLLLL